MESKMIDFHNPAIITKLFNKIGLSEKDFSEVEAEVKREKNNKLEQLTFGNYFTQDEITLIKEKTQEYCGNFSTPQAFRLSLKKELDNLESSLAYGLFMHVDTISGQLAEKMRKGQERFSELRRFYG